METSHQLCKDCEPGQYSSGSGSTSCSTCDAGKISAADSEPTEENADQPIIWPANVGSPEQVFYAQQQRMQDSIDKLAPRAPGKTNLYLISFAGDGEENVFRNEVDYVEKLFSERFDAKGRILTLVNNPSTLDRRPIASLSNLEIAIDALGKKLDPNDDVLMRHDVGNHRFRPCLLRRRAQPHRLVHRRVRRREEGDRRLGNAQSANALAAADRNHTRDRSQAEKLARRIQAGAGGSVPPTRARTQRPVQTAQRQTQRRSALIPRRRHSFCTGMTADAPTYLPPVSVFR